MYNILYIFSWKAYLYKRLAAIYLYQHAIILVVLPFHIMLTPYSFTQLVFGRGVAPSPRSDHAAAVHAERYLLIFGGGSHATCFNDLHVLDLQTVRQCIQFLAVAKLLKYDSLYITGDFYIFYLCRWSGQRLLNRVKYQVHVLAMLV